MGREIEGLPSHRQWPVRGSRASRGTALVALIALAGLALRMARLDFQPLWWDEGYSVWFATHPPGQMAALTAADIHPPLYYLLLSGWTRLAGTAPVALRLLSVAFGTLAIPAVYLAARRLFGRRRVALLAAFLAAINPLHIFYSQEVRMYGLVALLSTLILAAAWRAVHDPPAGDDRTPRRPPAIRRRAPYIAYILLSTLALYTQYYAAFLPAGLTLYALWRWRRDGRALARWLAAQAVIALLYLPWVLYAGPKLVSYVSQKVVADADRPLGLFAYLGRHLSAFLAGHLEGPLAPWWPVALALLAPFGVGWWLIARRRGADGTTHVADGKHEGAPGPDAPAHPASSDTPPEAGSQRTAPGIYLASAIATALALGWLISLRAPFFPDRGERLLVLALPPFLLLFAAALDAIRERWRVTGYVMLALISATSITSLAAFYTVPRYADDDYRPLIGRVSQQGLPGDAVYCVYPWQAGYWRSYAPLDGPVPLLSPAGEWGPTVAAALDAALAQGRVWFPAHLALGAILETQAEAHLAGRALTFANEWHGPNTRLSAWAGSGPDPADFVKEGVADGLPVRFAAPGSSTVALESVAGSTLPVPAANAITPLALSWQAGAAPPVLAVSVRLTDELGQIWAQHDYEPLGGLDRTGTLSTSGEGGQGPGAAVTPDASLPAVAQGGTGAGWRSTDRLGLLIPAGTPPGRYRVELVVRPKAAERPLDALGPDGVSLGGAAPLFDLEVAPADRSLDPERLPIAFRKPTDLDDGLRFLGFSMDQGALAPGELRKVSLFWQATSQPVADTVAFVQVLGKDGAPVALWEAPPGAAYASSAWAPGTLVRTQAGFRIPGSVPDGRYRLIAGLFRADDRARLLTPSGADYIALGTLTLRGRVHQLTPPEPRQPADAIFGSVARLMGYDLDLQAGAVRPGGSFTLTLHWQALNATDRPYTVFVHLVDETGTARGSGDAEPGNGGFPTPGWRPGEYLADAHAVLVAPDAEPGTYRLAVGFYEPASGVRLRTPGGDDRVTLEMPVRVE